MQKISMVIKSNQELWELFDQRLQNVLIQNFNPNESIEWWNTTIKFHSEFQNKIEFNNISVRRMRFDLQTNLAELEKIIDLNIHFLNIYQFAKPIPNTMVPEYLPERNQEMILKQNGLKHLFIIEHEFLTIGSFDEEYLDFIKAKPKLMGRIFSSDY